MQEYPSTCVPNEIAASMEGAAVRCPTCGSRFIVSSNLPATVKLWLTLTTEMNNDEGTPHGR